MTIPVGIDTGSDGTLILFSRTLDKYDIATRDKRGEKAGFSLDSTMTRNSRMRLTEVQYFDTTVRRLKAMRHTDPVSNAAHITSKWDGLIGQKLLNHYRIIYDLPGQKLYYKRRQPGERKTRRHFAKHP